MTLSEALIRTVVGSANFEKGKAYYQSSAVKNARKRGNTLMADVEGSQPQPYQVTITLSEDAIIQRAAHALTRIALKIIANTLPLC